MRKNFIKTLFAMTMVVATVSTTGLTAQAAETKTEAATETQALNKSVIAQVFDAKYYAESYPDVVAVLGNDADVLLNHYITNGIKEGRDASATFNASIYAVANSDLIAVYGDNLEGYIEHYVSFGINENRVASTAAYTALDVKTRATMTAQTLVASKDVAGFDENVMGITSTVSNGKTSYSSACLSPSQAAYQSALSWLAEGHDVSEMTVTDIHGNVVVTGENQLELMKWHAGQGPEGMTFDAQEGKYYQTGITDVKADGTRIYYGTTGATQVYSTEQVSTPSQDYTESLTNGWAGEHTDVSEADFWEYDF